MILTDNFVTSTLFRQFDVEVSSATALNRVVA
jgi:hypothetical protein